MQTPDCLLYLSPTVGGATGFTAERTRGANSTDVAGQVTGTEGGAGTAASTIVVTFNQTYQTAPIVVLTPASANAGTVGAYVSATAVGSFRITTINATVAGAAHTWNYQVIEAD